MVRKINEEILYGDEIHKDLGAVTLLVDQYMIFQDVF